MPVVSVHAPTLLVTQRVWGPDPWAKVDRSLELAARRRAPTRWCVHPPFRWQRDYAADFVDGRGRCASTTPASPSRWRTCSRGAPATARCWPTAGLGPGQPAVRPRHARPLAHRDRRVRRAGRWPRRSAPGCGTCTWPTAAAPAGTSTWCPGAAPSPAPSCWRPLAQQRSGVRRGRGRHPAARRGRARGRPRRGARVRPAAPGGGPGLSGPGRRQRRAVDGVASAHAMSAPRPPGSSLCRRTEDLGYP